MDTSTNPPWLDDTFLDKVLQAVKEFKEEMEVVKYDYREAVPFGKNFCSNMYRVSIGCKTKYTDTPQSLFFIVKTPQKSGKLEVFVDKLDLYNVESRVYNEIFPKMYEMHNLRVTPKSYSCQLNQFLILEDLRASGYFTVNRLNQLDFPHCHHFLSSLAKYHALSVAIHNNHSQLVENVGQHWCFSDQIPESEQQARRTMVNALYLVMLDTMKGLDGCKQYVNILQEKIDSYWGEMVKLIKSRDGLKVMNHGDAAITNVMFKYNVSGEPIDAKLLDFRFSHYSSFALDILHFWWSSANEEVHKHHREQLFEVYRLTLNKTLIELACSERLSKEDFDLEMRACSPYSLHVISGKLSLVMADPEDILDCENIVATKEAASGKTVQGKNNHKSKYYKAILPTILKQMELSGIFD